MAQEGEGGGEGEDTRPRVLVMFSVEAPGRCRDTGRVEAGSYPPGGTCDAKAVGDKSAREEICVLLNAGEGWETLCVAGDQSPCRLQILGAA